MLKTLSLSQEKALSDIKGSFGKGNKKVAFCMMTGGGKTVIATHFIKELRESAPAYPILFIMRGRKITRQNFRIMKEIWGKNVGLILQGTKKLKPISVASIDTVIANPLFALEAQAFFKVVIVDEAHLITSQGFMNFLKGMPPGVNFLGLSATYGINNKRIHNFWDDFVIGPDGWHLVKEGMIPPLKTFMPNINYNLDEVSISKSTGDYVTEELYQAVNKDIKLYGDILENYKKLGHERPAIAFCINIKHCEKIHKMFVRAGYNSIIFHSGLSTAERKKNEKKLLFFTSTKQSFVIVSVDMLTAGVDIPELEVGLMLRPTKSENKYRQQAGRLTRQPPGVKQHLTLLDFTRNRKNFGHIYYMLPPVRHLKKEYKPKPSYRCEDCFFITHEKFTDCPNCGKKKQAKARDVSDKDFEAIHNKNVTMISDDNMRERISSSMNFIREVY